MAGDVERVFLFGLFSLGRVLGVFVALERGLRGGGVFMVGALTVISV